MVSYVDSGAPPRTSNSTPEPELYARRPPTRGPCPAGPHHRQVDRQRPPRRVAANQRRVPARSRLRPDRQHPARDAHRLLLRDRRIPQGRAVRPNRVGPPTPSFNFYVSTFDFTIYLQAKRSTKTMDGRHYDLFVGAKDTDNTDGKTVAIYVPKVYTPPKTTIQSRSLGPSDQAEILTSAALAARSWRRPRWMCPVNSDEASGSSSRSPRHGSNSRDDPGRSSGSKPSDRHHDRR